MNYLILLIGLLFLSSIGHSFIFSMRLSRRLTPFFVFSTTNIEIDTTESSIRKVDDNFRILLTTIFFICPLVLYYCLKSTPIDNLFITYALMILIVLTSLFTLWFSIQKLKHKDSRIKNMVKRIEFKSSLNNLKKPVNSPLIVGTKNPAAYTSELKAEAPLKLTAKKREAYKWNKIQKENLDAFENLLNKLETFEYWMPAFKQFKLSNFKTPKNKVIKSKQAWLTFIICFHEEVLKTREYTGNLKSQYYKLVSKMFLNKTPDINRADWKNFREGYIDNGGIEDLKNSDFYKELVKFIIKNTKM